MKFSRQRHWIHDSSEWLILFRASTHQTTKKQNTTSSKTPSQSNKNNNKHISRAIRLPDTQAMHSEQCKKHHRWKFFITSCHFFLRQNPYRGLMLMLCRYICRPLTKYRLGRYIFEGIRETKKIKSSPPNSFFFFSQPFNH